MQVILGVMFNSLSGAISRSSGYSLKRKPGAFDKQGRPVIVSQRNAKYREGSWSDPRHVEFILSMAKMAVTQHGNPISDIRVSVRELVDAHTSMVTGQPLAVYPKATRDEVLKVWCGVLTLCAKHSKPTTNFNAQQVLRVEKLLRGIT